MRWNAREGHKFLPGFGRLPEAAEARFAAHEGKCNSSTKMS